MLNIQPLEMRSPSHSLSSLECEEVNQYHEKMQFVHSIIQDICRSRKFVVEFLRRLIRGWSWKEQGGLKITQVHLIQIQESNGEKGMEQQAMKGQAVA